MMAKDEVLSKMKLGLVTPEQAVKEFEATAPKIKSGAAGNTRTYRPKARDLRVQQYEKERAMREATLQRKMPFINTELSDGFYLSQGLVIVGGVTGKGKSTVAANILAGFLNYDRDRTVIVITNEESSEAVYNRTACVLLKYNFMDYQNNRLSTSRSNEVRDLAHELTNRVEVVDDDAWDMTCLEDVQAVLEYAATGNVGLAMIDYHQTVAFSRENPQAETFRVSKQFGLYLKDYGRKVGIPVIDFAQLKTSGKENDIEFKDRVENDKTLANHAFQIVEIVPDFEARQTKFVIHKDRFGYQQGKVIETKFVDGRYEALLGDSL
jgi:predicted ATP-dependent serine protease